MLKISNLSMSYHTRKGDVKALRNIDFEMEKGDIVGLVGESGCGKSTLLLAVMRLIPGSAVIESGEIMFQDEDILARPVRELRKIRGRKIAMIFQDPMTTLNPVFKVGDQIREALRVHNIVQKQGKWPIIDRVKEKKEQEIVIDLMKEVHIPSPESRYSEYPHEFSGGMQQRALIAMALSCKPDLLLADEPTTALDVTVQAQIMSLLAQINRERGTGIVLVTHDLALASEFCRKIVIMYAGEIVEQGATAEIIENPMHPYTKGLLSSIPKIGCKDRIQPIRGMVPELMGIKDDCAFYPRCDHAGEDCMRKIELTEMGEGRFVRCCQVKA